MTDYAADRSTVTTAWDQRMKLLLNPGRGCERASLIESAINSDDDVKRQSAARLADVCPKTGNHAVAHQAVQRRIHVTPRGHYSPRRSSAALGAVLAAMDEQGLTGRA